MIVIRRWRFLDVHVNFRRSRRHTARQRYNHWPLLISAFAISRRIDARNRVKTCAAVINAIGDSIHR